MEKMPILKRILYIIINFLKMIFLYIVDFILYLFGRQEENIKKEIIVVTKELKHGTVTLRDGEYSVPIDPSSLVSDPGNSPDEVLKRKEHIVYKHISNQYDGSIKMFTVTTEMINTIIDEYIEEKEEITLKKLDKEKIKVYELWKEEIIVPKVKIELEKMYIENQDTLKKSISKIVDEELELEKKKVNEVKEVIKENEETEKTIVINNKEDIIIDFHDELKNTNIELSENIAFTATTPFKKSIELKNEVVDILESSSLILSNVEKELIEDKKSIISNTSNIVSKNEEVIEENKVNEVTELSTPIMLEEIKEIVEKKDTIKKEEVINELDNKVSKKDIEVIEQVIEAKEEHKELIKEQEVILEQVKLPNVNINEDSIEDKVRNERYKEDFEDRDYDSLEDKINEALEKIDNFIVMNEKKLTNQQLIQLEKQKERLELTKDKIKRQRDLDIEAERRELENNIHRKEISGLQQHLLNMHLENQIDMTNNLINRIEDLENMSYMRARQIEKQLIKQKLKKAARSATVPALLALPFIRNKYFLFFTGGLIVNRHLTFIGDIFRRQTTPYQELDLSNLVTGRDSLNEALNTTRYNIDYLDAIEEEAKRRYPELMKDSDYLTSINRLKTNLNNNYNRLTRRHNTIERVIYKTKNHVKVLKKNNKKKKLNNAA